MQVHTLIVMATDTTIRVSEPIRDQLRAAKEGGETYNELFARLLEETQ